MPSRAWGNKEDKTIKREKDIITEAEIAEAATAYEEALAPVEYTAEERAYIDFMNNPENAGRCGECPENRGFGSWGGCLPCGQQNCWVSCHCREVKNHG